MPLPALIVVSGPPGSGKSQLARTLADAIGCPLVSRDAIKEGMAHAYGPGFEPAAGDDLTKRTFMLFFDTIRLQLEADVTTIAEAAFQDPRWRDGLTPLLPLAQLRVIHCAVADAIAQERMRRRMSDPRRAAHADAAWLDAWPKTFMRISLPAPSIVVDTTDGYAPDLAEIVRFASGGSTRPE